MKRTLFTAAAVLVTVSVLAAPAAADDDAEFAAQDALMERYNNAQTNAEQERIAAEACSRWGGAWCPGYHGSSPEPDPAPEGTPRALAHDAQQCGPPDCDVNSVGYHSSPQRPSQRNRNPCAPTNQHCQAGRTAAESRLGSRHLSRPTGHAPTDRRMAARAVCIDMARDLDLVRNGGEWQETGHGGRITRRWHETEDGKYMLALDRPDQISNYNQWLAGCGSVMKESPEAAQLLRQ